MDNVEELAAHITGSGSRSALTCASNDGCVKRGCDRKHTVGDQKSSAAARPVVGRECEDLFPIVPRMLPTHSQSRTLGFAIFRAGPLVW